MVVFALAPLAVAGITMIADALKTKKSIAPKGTATACVIKQYTEEEWDRIQASKDVNEIRSLEDKAAERYAVMEPLLVRTKLIPCAFSEKLNALD